MYDTTKPEVIKNRLCECTDCLKLHYEVVYQAYRCLLPQQAVWPGETMKH